MSAEFDSGAFVREAAWHKQGHVSQENMTTADFIVKAGMDWVVEEHPVHLPNGNLIEGYKALVRSDNGYTLHIAGESFTPLQNHEAFSWFDPFIQDGDLYLSAAVSLRYGKRVALTAEFTDQCKAEVIEGDEVQLKLVLFNSHDGSLSVGIKFTPIRVVCNNTLQMAVAGTNKSFEQGDLLITERFAKARHTKNLSVNLKTIREQINLGRRQFKELTIPQYQAMTSVKMTTELWKRYLEYTFNLDGISRTVESLRDYDRLCTCFEYGLGHDIPGVRGTAWAAYNAVTQTLTSKERIDSLLFGNYAKTIFRAHEAALSLTKA